MIEMHVELYKPRIVVAVVCFPFFGFATDEPNNVEGPIAVLHRACVCEHESVHTVCESVLIEYTIKSTINASHGHAKRPALCSLYYEMWDNKKEFTYDICLNVCCDTQTHGTVRLFSDLPESHTETIEMCLVRHNSHRKIHTESIFACDSYEWTGDLFENGASERANEQLVSRRRQQKQAQLTLLHILTFSHMHVRSI